MCAPGIAYRSAEAGVPSGAVSRAAELGTSRPTTGPMTPPATIPMAGLEAQRDPDRDDRADDRRHEFAPAGDEPDREADHRGREDDVDAEPGRIRDLGAEEHAGQRREVPRDERRGDGADPVAALIGPTRPAGSG